MIMAALSDAEAFLLLNVPNCSISVGTTSQSGTLALECVTIQMPGSSSRDVDDHDIYLVLRLNETEVPIEPIRIIRTNISDSGSRRYTFLATDADPVELVLTVAMPNFPDSHFLEDIEVFESILSQYADLRDAFVQDSLATVQPDIYDKTGDLRGHLVLVNQDNGEVVGEFDKKFSVQEDPSLSKKGHESDPVVIEVPESYTDDGNAMEIFVRAIPPDQQDWITKGATIISHAITGSTNLLLTTISAASSYYTSHSTPSPSITTPANSNASSGSLAAPPLPPRAVAFLSSARTRKGLAAVHSVSGQAVKISANTVEIIDGMIKLAMGSSKGKQKASQAKQSATLAPGSAPPLPPRTPSPSPSSLPPPPPYTSSPGMPLQSGEKPALPPRRQPSPSPSKMPPSFPPRTKSGFPTDSAATGEQSAVKLSTKTRILLSADLILSTIDISTRRILDSGTENIGTVVGHKYGASAGESSVLMAGTARNMALVYIDMRGIGRRALLRRAGKEFIKGRVADASPKE
ncbi:hypothetical protein B0H10DRAFT_2022357 [Mycena sp. CBHHK59/15]|nr:hypothetical protein B0H10DRAFT_2022357 [Mycena sp. CBHHK59/15]